MIQLFIIVNLSVLNVSLLLQGETLMLPDEVSVPLLYWSFDITVWIDILNCAGFFNWPFSKADFRLVNILNGAYPFNLFNTILQSFTGKLKGKKPPKCQYIKHHLNFFSKRHSAYLYCNVLSTKWFSVCLFHTGWKLMGISLTSIVQS